MNRILTWLFAGTTSILMSACYGVVEDYSGVNVNVSVKDSSDNPIAGLEVVSDCSPYNGDVTNNYGDAILSFSDTQEFSECQIIVTDKDGELNGGKFKSKSVSMSNAKTSYDIQMELDEE